MKTITVAELRQNPTSALAEVEAGETYRITRHGREVGRIVPTPQTGIALIPPTRSGGIKLSGLPRHAIRTAESIGALLDEERGEW